MKLQEESPEAFSLARRAFDKLLRRLRKEEKSQVPSTVDTTFTELDGHDKIELSSFLIANFLKYRKEEFPEACEGLLVVLFQAVNAQEEVLRWWVAREACPLQALEKLKKQQLPAYAAFQTFLEDFKATPIQVISTKAGTKLLKFRAFEQDFELEISSIE